MLQTFRADVNSVSKSRDITASGEVTRKQPSYYEGKSDEDQSNSSTSQTKPKCSAGSTFPACQCTCLNVMLQGTRHSHSPHICIPSCAAGDPSAATWPCSGPPSLAAATWAAGTAGAEPGAGAGSAARAAPLHVQAPQAQAAPPHEPGGAGGLPAPLIMRQATSSRTEARSPPLIELPRVKGANRAGMEGTITGTGTNTTRSFCCELPAG
jgi:hypothetical protein